MRALTVALLVSAAAAAHADGTPAAPGDSIAEAKKDFASIKASRSPAETASGLPVLDMRDLGPSPGMLLPPTPTPTPLDAAGALDPAKRKSATGNWLVDAMDKKGDRAKSERPGDELLRDDPNLLREDERQDTHAERDAPPARDSREKPGSRELAQQVYNPLDSFMGSWISARDHDLLLPSGKAEGAAAGDAPRARADALPLLESGPASSFVDSALPSPDSGSWADTKVAANPYLSLLEIAPEPAARSFSAPENPGFLPGELMDLPRTPVLSGVDARPPDAARSFIPDFAQPTDDDKYFRQMKRF